MTDTKTREPIEVVPGQVEAFDLPAIEARIARQYTGVDAQRYQRAEARAKGKQLHCAPPGVLDLPASSYGWNGAPNPGDCASGWNDADAQLRTAYVRLAVGGQRGDYRNNYTSVQGRPTWTPVGIVCGKCGALWLRPAAPPVDSDSAKTPSRGRRR